MNRRELLALAAGVLVAPRVLVENKPFLLADLRRAKAMLVAHPAGGWECFWFVSEAQARMIAAEYGGKLPHPYRITPRLPA